MNSLVDQRAITIVMILRSGDGILGGEGFLCFLLVFVTVVRAN